MGGRIVELLSSPHRAAEALMPWLLNDTLEPDERRQLEAHLRDCAECRAELERQRRLAGVYCSVEITECEDDASVAFARLNSRLDAQAAAAQPAPRRARPARGWRLVAALQFCVIAALAWTVWLLRPATVEPAGAPAEYRGLAAAAAPTHGDAIVLFVAEASEADMRHALRQARARIIDGPTPLGAYVLRFDSGTVEEAVAALRADRNVMRVEPLVATDKALLQ